MTKTKGTIDQTVRVKEDHERYPYIHKYIENTDLRAILDETIDCSFEQLGFFTTHPPRAYEYPWIVRELRKTTGKAVDLGAGLSPVPFMLAEHGIDVTTCDNSPLIRSLDDQANWNEWGFLDYALIDDRIRSENIDFGLIELENGSVDTVYSISVVEHMPAEIRRRVTETVGQVLRSGGHFILTLDLHPDTYDLWNRARGREVEQKSLHGTIFDFVTEMDKRDILLQSIDIKRRLPGSATDIATLIAVKK